MELTAENLTKGMNTTPLIATAWVTSLNTAIDEFRISTLNTTASLLGNIAVESLRLQLTRELWGPTASQVRYERDFDSPWPKNDIEARMPAFNANRLAYTLGNSEAGDGKKYAGQGPIQITGRTNMKKCGDALGYDLLTYPQTLQMPLAGSRSAAWYFAKFRPCLDLAEAGDWTGVRRKINGGANGLQDSIRFTNQFLKVLA